MNKKMKRRMTAVTGVIVIVLIVVLAVVGSATAATSITVLQATTGDYTDERVQVSGNVVEDSFEITENVLTFEIYDPDGDESVHLSVSYEGGVAATFGNDVTAICTGTIGEDGVLHASELVTKCPSKYENATGSLSVSSLLDYGETIYGKTVKVSGTVKAGTLQAAGGDERFVLVDADDDSIEISVAYNGALSDEVSEGSSLVLTGSLSSDLTFSATDVALEG